MTKRPLKSGDVRKLRYAVSLVAFSSIQDDYYSTIINGPCDTKITEAKLQLSLGAHSHRCDRSSEEGAIGRQDTLASELVPETFGLFGRAVRYVGAAR